MRHGTGKALIIVCSAIAALVLLFFICFPGSQGLMAIKLATGWSIQDLQERVDEIEAKVIGKKPLDAGEREFLRDLYSCLATGGKLTVILRQTGSAMGHYLDCKGTDLKTDKRIFVKSDIVQANMEELRKAVLESPPARLQSDEPFKSRTFNMADRSCIDSYAGLYYGHLEVEVVRVEDERLILKWRAECPWEWPSYEYMSREYGNPHHLIFPIPNVRYALAALLSSSGEARQYALWLDDGLGEHLTHIGLAKSFVLYSEWQEEINPNTEGDA